MIRGLLSILSALSLLVSLTASTMWYHSIDTPLQYRWKTKDTAQQFTCTNGNMSLIRVVFWPELPQDPNDRTINCYMRRPWMLMSVRAREDTVIRRHGFDLMFLRGSESPLIDLAPDTKSLLVVRMPNWALVATSAASMTVCLMLALRTGRRRRLWGIPDRLFKVPGQAAFPQASAAFGRATRKTG